MPPRRSARPFAEPQPAPRSTSRGRKPAAKAEPILVEDDSESDGIEEIAPPPKAAPKARRGRPAKNAIKEEDEVEEVREEPSKGKGKGKASTVVPAKRRANRQVVGEQTDKENTAGETTPVEDAPKRTMRRTSRQPSVAKAAPTARKVSGGRRKRGQDVEEEEEEEEEERPMKRAAIKEEAEIQEEDEEEEAAVEQEAAAEPEVDELKHDEDAAELPTAESPEAEERSVTPVPPQAQKPAAKAKGRGKTKEPAPEEPSEEANSTPPRSRTKPPSPSPSPPPAKSQTKRASQSQSQRRKPVPESDTEEERDLLAEAAATPLRPKLGARESLSMSAAQLQQLSSQAEPNVLEKPVGPKKRLVIHKIALVNFKSYAGRQEIGPFHKSFSAIVGPNGSGKSNTIDALLFVFGYRASKMRQGKLSELIHNSAEWPDFDMCSVEVWFREIVDLPGPDSYEVVPNSRLIVSRTAYKSNKSEYTINAKPSNYSEVTSLLKSRGIDLDHKRFLILQGEVESIAQMKPKAPNEHEDGLLEYLEDIIGTARYKEPIEEALTEADRLAEERGEKMARLKIVEKEKGKLEAEKLEAEAFLRDQNELVRAQSKLWQYNIFRCQKNVEATKAHIATLQAELDAETTANAEHIRAAEELKAQYEEQREAFDVLERELVNVSKSLSAQSKTEVGLEEKKKHVKAKEKKLLKGIADDTHAKHEAETWMTNHAEQIEKSTKELAKYEKELVAQEKELEAIADSLKGKTQVFHDKIQAKQAELAPWQQKIAECEGSLGVTTRERDLLASKGKSALQAVEDAGTTLQALKDEYEVKETELSTAKSERAKSKKELQDAEKTLRDMAARVEQLRSNAATSRHKRDEAKSSNAQNTSQNAVLDSLLKLKASGKIQGFHGRLGSLGTIPDKFDVAVTTAVGTLNNMVVDTVDQAQDCIAHLRQHNVGRANFYVLEKLNINPQNMQPIQTPDQTPRLFDLITPKHPRFANAFYMAMRDTLVADNLENAERIAYSGKRWRVVTLGGQLIDVSGTMSGGGTRVSRGGMSSKLAADHVSPDVIRRYEQDSEKAEQEHGTALGEMRSYERRVEDLKRRAPEMDTIVSKLEMDIQGLGLRIKDAEKRLRDVQNESKPNANDVKRIAALEKDIASIGGELAKLRTKAAAYEQDISDLQDKILEVGGVKLRSQRSKVDDTKGMIELANELLFKAEAGQTKCEKDSKKCIQSIEASENALKETEADMAVLDADLQTCRADMQKLQKAVSQAEAAKDTYEDNLKELKEELDEKLKLTRGFRAKEQELTQQIAESGKELKVHKIKMKDFVQMHDRLELQDVDDDDDEEEEKSDIEAIEKQAEPAGEGEDAEENADDAEPKIKADLDGHASKGSKKRDPMELRLYSEDELAGMSRDRLVADVSILEEKVGNAKPNLNVLVEYRRRENEYLARAKEFERVTKQRDEQKAKYEELRKRRLDEFMAGFNAISSKLKEMYQMITLGGNAELDLVDSMDPFSEGVNFSVMPPKKSWKNISNLSGGEKTLSSLALVFALHVFKPTPLYFMDEIDAALDFRNVSIVANYIKDRTKDAQFIIISLRNDMFELSHRLVGIYKTANATRSICIDNKPLMSTPAPGTQNGSIKA